MQDINADFYVMVDGDQAYDTIVSQHMLAMAIDEHLNLINCILMETGGSAYLAGHRLSSRMLTEAVWFVCGDWVQDMLSGYKVLSRRYLKSSPAWYIGFGTETELTVHAQELQMPMGHTQGAYDSRPDHRAS